MRFRNIWHKWVNLVYIAGQLHFVRARSDEVRLLMIKIQPSYACLQDVMLENTKYNLGRKCEFYATAPPGQGSKGGQKSQSGKTYHTKSWLLQQPSKWYYWPWNVRE